MTPSNCVVDTNVVVTANGSNEAATPACAAACAGALQQIMHRGTLFIDDHGLILEEYRKNTKPYGQPTPGNAFLKWLLTHEWNAARVTRVPLRREGQRFEQLPSPPAGIRYDPSDEKFLAVSAAHKTHPPVLQALDSKWWGWQESLAAAGVSLHFLCPAEIARKFSEKVEP